MTRSTDTPSHDKPCLIKEINKNLMAIQDLKTYIGMQLEVDRTKKPLEECCERHLRHLNNSVDHGDMR